MKAVIYGAGNVGRGFIGQLFFQSGYDVVFIDVNTELTEQINAQKKYPICFTDLKNSDSPCEIWIENVCAVDGNNKNDVIKEIENADIMATSVGVNAMKNIFEPLALGINKRFKDNNFTPLNIIVCENLINAGKIMKDGVYTYIDAEFQKLFEHKTGFAEASIGRTVPIQTEQMKSNNALRILTESYSCLPVDKNAFCGKPPKIKNMLPVSNFEFYMERKLYVHNMGHTLCAYLGNLFGYEYIWEAIKNPYLKLITMRAMLRSAFALCKKHNVDICELNEYIENLLFRFSNKSLSDTAERVGNDLKRKLSPNDRFIGTLDMCRQQGNVNTCYIDLAIAAALTFKSDTDKLSGLSVDEILNQAGSKEIVGSNIAVIEKLYEIIKNVKTPKKLLEFIEIEENISKF